MNFVVEKSLECKVDTTNKGQQRKNGNQEEPQDELEIVPATTDFVLIRFRFTLAFFRELRTPVKEEGAIDIGVVVIPVAEIETACQALFISLFDQVRVWSRVIVAFIGGLRYHVVSLALKGSINMQLLIFESSGR